MEPKIDFELVSDNKKNRKGVLLFHGLTGSPFEMKKYGNFLFKEGYDVFCYSLPGHGERLSEIKSVEYTDWTSFAQSKYDLLKERYGEFYVSGLCLGAVLALYLAEENPDIKGIALLSTTLFLNGFSIPWISLFIPFANKTIVRYFYTFPEDDCLGIKNERTRKSLRKIMEKTTVGMDNYPLNCVKELLELSSVVRKNLNKITCPLLCIHSKYDNLSTVKSAKVVMEGVKSENKKYIELNDSYHMVLYDNEKDFVMNNVLEFLKSLSLEKIEEPV